MNLFGMRFPLLTPRVVVRENPEEKFKTKRVLLDVDVLNRIFKYFLTKGQNEGACLLLGKIEGEFLVINDIHECKKSIGSRASIVIRPEEFFLADKGNDNLVIGWVHSHPDLGVFMSSIDKDTQNRYFQAFFNEAVAMVMDPLSENGIEFNFFRVLNGNAINVDYQYLVRRNV